LFCVVALLRPQFPPDGEVHDGGPQTRVYK
jgi:hypothetical protein